MFFRLKPSKLGERGSLFYLEKIVAVHPRYRTLYFNQAPTEYAEIDVGDYQSKLFLGMFPIEVARLLLSDLEALAIDPPPRAFVFDVAERVRCYEAELKKEQSDGKPQY